MKANSEKCDTYFNLKPIKPLPKISKESVKTLDLANKIPLWNKLYQSQKEQQTLHIKLENDLLYKQSLDGYINRICPNPKCKKNLLFDKCINKCIFPKNDIQYSQIDDTSIYHFPNSICAFTQEGIKKASKFYLTIPNQKLIDIFHVNATQLDDLKIQLSDNPLISFINHYWGEYSNDEKFDILRIILNPTEKIANPITLKSILYDYSYPTTLEDLNNIRYDLNLAKTAEILLHVMNIPNNEETAAPLQNRVFTTTLDAFLTACFPKASPKDLAEKNFSLK